MEEHQALGIPTIRRVLQNIRVLWKENSDQKPFSVFDKKIVPDNDHIAIDRFCFYFIANKYNRRHLKYLAKRKKEGNATDALP